MCSEPTVIRFFAERRKHRNEGYSVTKANIAAKDANLNNSDPPKLDVDLEENASELQAIHEAIVSSGTDTGNVWFQNVTLMYRRLSRQHQSIWSAHSEYPTDRSVASEEYSIQL